jgi:hypothetical protein
MNFIQTLTKLNHLYTSIAGSIIIVFISGCSVFGINSVEEARYQVIKKVDNYELREYQALLVVETQIDADFEEAGGLAFDRLFGYISGNNEQKSKIAMTAPVIARQNNSEQGEKINMTAPVFEEKNDGGWRFMFVLPASYSIETAPIPLDPEVKLSVIPKKKVAVNRYTGFWDEKVMIEKMKQLDDWVVANDLVAASKPRWAGYNPPWTIPFLRRNEVMIDVM